jgi:hypothetical protein
MIVSAYDVVCGALQIRHGSTAEGDFHFHLLTPLAPVSDTSGLSWKGGFMAKARKKRRAWTSAEVRDLKAMARKKTKASQIAKKLRRTEGATRQKAFSLGLSLDSRSWTFQSIICFPTLIGAGLLRAGSGTLFCCLSH